MGVLIGKISVDVEGLSLIDFPLNEHRVAALIAGAQGHDVACLAVLADIAGLRAGAVVESVVVVLAPADYQRLVLLLGILLHEPQGFHSVDIPK